MSKFVYKKRTAEDVQKQLDLNSSGGRDRYTIPGIPYFRPSQGITRIRILPPGWEDADHYGYRVFMHYGIGADTASYVCPKRTVNPHTDTKDDCPICEEEENTRIDAEPGSADEIYANKLRSKQRTLVYVLERGKNGNNIPKLWSMPATVDKDILNKALDPITNETLCVDDPFNGYDIDLTVEGVGERTKYSVNITRHPSEIVKFEEEVWPLISEQKSIANILIFQEYDYLKKVFNGKIVSNSTPKPKTAKDLTYDELLKVKNLQALDKLILTYNIDFDTSNYEDISDAKSDLASELGFASVSDDEDEDIPFEVTPDLLDEEPTPPKTVIEKPDLKARLAALRKS